MAAAPRRTLSAVAKKAEERGNAELAVKALKLIVSGKVMDAFRETCTLYPALPKTLNT